MKLKKFISIVINATMCLSLFSVNVSANENDILNYEEGLIFSSKIDMNLNNIIESSSDDELIPVSIWFNDIDQSEVEKCISTELLSSVENIYLRNEQMSFDNIQLEKNQEEIVQDNDLQNAYENNTMQTYIETKRSASREIYNAYNTGSLTSVLGEVLDKNRDSRIIFVSEYSPSTSVYLTPQEIKLLENSSEIDGIYYYDMEFYEALTNESFPLTGIDYVRDTAGYKGSGIKIGMIDAGLVTKTDNVFKYSRNNIYLDPNVKAYDNTNHATYVASLMVGNSDTYKGVVPNATLYSSTVNRNDGYKGSFEWLLSNGVNVINVSLAYGSDGYNNYGDVAKFVDHIAINHDVHVVVAAGNYGQSGICSGSMGYNSIVVGNADDVTTNLASSSSYIVNTAYPYRPDLSAPGTGIRTEYSSGDGTSIAAPHVTGVVAQLCQMNATMKTNQALVKSILMCGAVTGTKYNATTGFVDLRYYGAGLLNAKNSRYIANNSRYKAVTLPSTSSTYSTTFNVTSSDTTVRVALAWLKNNRYTSSSHTSSSPTSPACDKLTLKVTAPDGTVYTATRSAANAHVIHFEPKVTGTYTITVTRTNTTTANTYFAVSYY